MKIFVTGASGFIGKKLVNELAKKGHTVTALTRKTQSRADLIKIGAKKVVIGDVTIPKTYLSELNKNEVLIHLASIRSNWGEKEAFDRVNAEAIKYFFRAKNLQHIIITSSVYVYGVLGKLPANEQTPLRATDFYGTSKIMAEDITKKEAGATGIPYTILRPAIVYGPFDNEVGMMSKMIKLVRNKSLPTIGDGENLLHLVYVDDLILAFVKALQNQGHNETYVIAGKKAIKLNSLILLIKKELGINYSVKRLPFTPIYLLSFLVEAVYRLGFNFTIPFFSKEPPLMPIKVNTLSRSWKYSILKANKILKYFPKTDYKEGIKKTLKSFNIDRKLI